MVTPFNAIFNNISVISWRSILLREVTRILGENHDLSQVTDKRYHDVVSSIPGYERDSNSQHYWLLILI